MRELVDIELFEIVISVGGGGGGGGGGTIIIATGGGVTR